MQKFLVGKKFQLVSIDICGPFPRSNNGNQFIMTVVDHFSKMAQAYSYCMPDHQASTVTKELTQGWIAQFGAMKELLSDNGTEFNVVVISRIVSMHGHQPFTDYFL